MVLGRRPGFPAGAVHCDGAAGHGAGLHGGHQRRRLIGAGQRRLGYLRSGGAGRHAAGNGRLHPAAKAAAGGTHRAGADAHRPQRRGGQGTGTGQRGGLLSHQALRATGAAGLRAAAAAAHRRPAAAGGRRYLRRSAAGAGDLSAALRPAGGAAEPEGVRPDGAADPQLSPDRTQGAADPEGVGL